MLCRRMKTHRSKPVVIVCHQGSLKPEASTIDFIVARIITPKKVPITFPTPPVRSVPPIIEEAIAFMQEKDEPDQMGRILAPFFLPRRRKSLSIFSIDKLVNEAREQIEITANIDLTQFGGAVPADEFYYGL